MFDIIAPVGQTLENINKQTALPYFSEVAIHFIGELAKNIQDSSILRHNPELVAMAFWMRKQRLLQLQARYQEQDPTVLRVGRGLVFHIAPANVDSIFFYSWFIALLAGNKNVVRISRGTIKSIQPLLDVLHQLLLEPQFDSIRQRTLLITYDRSQEEVTKSISALSDMRVIWGGDETINAIRAIPISAAAKELTFANKFSSAIIDANSYLVINDKEKRNLAKQFYNDAYWFGQMACSSPRLVSWLGSHQEVLQAKDNFWKYLESFALNQQHDISVADISNKIITTQILATTCDNCQIENMNSNIIVRIALSDLSAIPIASHCGAGLFYEVVTDRLEDIFATFNKSYQTIGYFGINIAKLKQLYLQVMPQGAIRFVPIGKALDFQEIWDGYELFSEFSKRVTFLQ